MRIEIAVQTHNFQRRLCWMLSSVLQSVGDAPEVVFDMAYVRNTGTPTNEEVVEVFHPLFRARGWTLARTEYPDISRFQYRGLTRNDQLAKTSADWIIFADTDMVYPPELLARAAELLAEEFAGSEKCLYAARRSTFLGPTEEMVDDAGRWGYPAEIPDAFGTASSLPGKKMPNVGAGYFHLVDVGMMRSKHKGVYQNPNRRYDWPWESRYQKARSDIRFRRRVGPHPIPLPRQIHLQHHRDSEYQEHIDLQR